MLAAARVLVERASKRWAAWLVVVGIIAMSYSIFAHYQQSLPKPPIWLYLIILTWALIGFDYYNRRKMPRGEGVKSVEILAPLNHAELGFRRIVAGSIQLPNSTVQVLVLEADRWYLQGAVAVDGHSWRVECQFGNEEGGLGKHYQIIAIADGNIKGGPFSSLPQTGVKSGIINVRRTH